MKNRLLSIDVLRGMTLIFMIIVNTPGSWDYVYAPLLHADWNGLTPTDYIFPNFLRLTLFDKLNKMLCIWLTYEKVTKMTFQQHTSSTISRKL